MIRLTTNVLGVFALKNNRVIEKLFFKGSPTDIAVKISGLSESACSEELELLKKLADTGSKQVAVNQPSRFWGKGLNLELVEDFEKPFDVMLVAGDLGLDKKKALELLRDVNLQLTRERLKVVEPDQVLIQAVAALDDIEEVSNKLVERLREWYSIHFPELNHLVEAHENYVQLVKDFGLRESFTSEKVKLEPGFRDRIVSEASKSVGSFFDVKDVEVVKAIALNLSEVFKTKAKIEEYIGVKMQETAPNISALVGPLLGARLIKLSNGLQRMATLPASTIQILGAEDAFFRFLKTGKNPPKHGIIFQHPEIRNSGRQTRGRLARTLAAKLSVAARIDAYHGEFIGEKLKEDFAKRVKALKK